MAESAELFEAISHPTRIRILKILEKQPSSFSVLKQKLKIDSSGNLDHHIKKLGQLISVQKDGSYSLSDAGKEALRAIESIEMWRSVENQKIKVFQDKPREVTFLFLLEIATAIVALFSLTWMSVPLTLTFFAFYLVYGVVAVLGFLSAFGLLREKGWGWTLVIVKASLVIFYALVPLYFTTRLWHSSYPTGISTIALVLSEALTLFVGLKQNVREFLGKIFVTSLPHRALVGGMLGIAGGLFEIMRGNFHTFVLYNPAYEPVPLEALIVFMFTTGLVIAAGGVLILLRKYMLGGVMVIVVSLFPTWNIFLHGYARDIFLDGIIAVAIFILFATGGILALLSRPKF